MMRRCLSAATVAGLWLITNQTATAQTTSRADISGGYQMVSFQGELDETFALGWYGELAAHVMPHLSFVFQVGGNYKSTAETFAFDGINLTATADVSVHQFVGGVRWRAARRNSITPFVHALAGAAKMAANVTAQGIGQGNSLTVSTSVDDTHAAFQAGGGVDVPVTGPFGVRAGADYVRLFDDEDGVNAFRFAIGGVWTF